MRQGSVPDSFFIHSGLDIAYADRAFCALLGADSPEQIVGMSLTDIVTPEYHSGLREQVARIENEDAPALGLAVDLQTFTDRLSRVIMMSSSVEWDGAPQVQTSVFPVAAPDSSTGRLLRDHAMDDAPIGITISDPSQPDNPLIYVNDEFCELTGYSRDEILGRNCRLLQGEATREEPVAQMAAAIDAEEPVTVELRNYRKSGSMFWNRVTIVPIRSASGNVTHYLGYQEDVTAEKRYEQDLSLFREQADKSDKAIFITDLDGTIEYVNPAFERLTGYTAGEAIGRNPSILKSGQQDEEFYAEMWEQITAGEMWEAELTNRTKHGKLFEIKQKIVPVTDGQGEITHFVGIEQDITEKVLARQTLAVLDRVLRHNLRNSLNVIEGHAEQLEAKRDAEARQASVDAIQDRVTEMKSITEKMADIRAVRDSTRSPSRVDIEDFVETYRRRYPDAEFTTAIGGDEAIRVRNADLFEKGIDEAVENAVKHDAQSPPEVAIGVQRDPAARQVCVSVADNGPGIPEFERQAIESGEETPMNHGLGVGLWVMKWATTTLGGELTIEDKEPRGSVVTFHLPIMDQSGVPNGDA